MSTRNYTSLGIMTGTSLDAVDLSLIISDGDKTVKFINSCSYAFNNKLRDSIRSILGSKKRDSVIDLIESNYTDFLIDKIKIFLKTKKVKVELIGLHGQTITHKPKENFTWQIGDGKKIFNTFKIPIVHNFRYNDIQNGGNGAPLTPVFHNLLRMKYRLQCAAFINLGGISNLTISNNKTLIAFDCGPCCSMSNDFVKYKINKEYDKGGILASKGKVNCKIVKQLLQNPYFKIHYPKSLDRLDIICNNIYELNLNDGLATINEFIAETIFLGLKDNLHILKEIILLGGGRKNIDLVNRIQKKINNKILIAEDLGIDGDFVEANCFAYLGIRSIKKLNITYQKTTGVYKSMTGGELID